MPGILLESEEFEELAVSILSMDQKLCFQARGESMRPFILSGDRVEVQPLHHIPLNRGTVVLCRLNDSRLVVHRVTQATLNSLLIQGDAMPYPDGYIPHKNVLGVVSNIYRKGKLIKFDSFWIKFLAGLWLQLTPIRQIGFRIIQKIRYFGGNKRD